MHKKGECKNIITNIHTCAGFIIIARHCARGDSKQKGNKTARVLKNIDPRKYKKVPRERYSVGTKFCRG